MYDEIDRRLGLLDIVEVVYAVDSYTATLVGWDELVIAEAAGETSAEALANLNIAIRAMMEVGDG